VINAGFMTNYFRVSRGERQGCRLSPLLFVLAVQILASKVRHDEFCRGINLPDNKESKISQFADDNTLSGTLAKSGPLDFATKNSFPLLFVCEKGLVYMYQKPLYLFSNSLFLLCYKPKTNFARNGDSGGDRKAEIYGF